MKGLAMPLKPMKPGARPSRRWRQAGATLMEFAVVFPLAALFVLCVIQAGFLYMAKSTLNHATFLAARAGALHNARQGAMESELKRAMIPFFQNSTDANDASRIGQAYVLSQIDQALPWGAKLTRLSPTSAAFKDFGVTDPVKKVKYIPNDNLEWRGLGIGANSRMHIRDANLLKVKVVYGYQLKVPLMAGLVSRLMCGGSIGVSAWGDVKKIDSVYGLTDVQKCLIYYQQGRIPIESFAIVEMQSRAEDS